jgi:ABC-type dipeptide/oligopeptide/nickel transport system ATPase component
MEDELLMIACNPGKGRSVNVYAIIHINHWKPVNSIETEIIVANQNMKQFQNTDTRRTVFKDPNYKDEKPEENIEIIE